ncbi:MAG: AI-2E family transporter [Oscillibacter sp.]|nr:AI-2E family transporter [Oscillibacter sp.]
MKQKGGYVRLGIIVFFTVSAILLFYDTLFGSHFLLNLLRQFVDALKPVLYGAFMAYLLAPVVNFFERTPSAVEARKQGRRASMGLRVISILLTWAIIGVLLYLLGSVLVPELYKSIQQLVANVETYYYTISGWITHLLENNPTLAAWVSTQMNSMYIKAENWVTGGLLSQATILVSVLSGSIFGIIGFFGELLVGAIVSVYFLATKEVMAAQARKVTCSLFTSDRVYWIMRGARKMDFIFSGFVRGKLLDSLIIGILCFIGCSALKFPYTPLVSVIVGVTNVIPFFGPFLGAIPSTFLILLASPIDALYFVLFVLALQQLDGNVIGPKILGDKTGLSSLWVIAAILVGGSFFGVIGMFFGVPVFACVYNVVTFYVESRLSKKDLPVETEAYMAGKPEGYGEKN